MTVLAAFQLQDLACDIIANACDVHKYLRTMYLDPWLSPYSTVCARQLLFGAPCQTIITWLSDVPPDICQLTPEICQTSTTHTPDMYHMPTRHILCHTYTRRPPDIYQTSTTYLSDVWYTTEQRYVYRKFSIKGAGRWGNILGGAPIRERAFPPSGGSLQNENRTIFSRDMPKNVQKGK